MEEGLTIALPPHVVIACIPANHWLLDIISQLSNTFCLNVLFNFFEVGVAVSNIK